MIETFPDLPTLSQRAAARFAAAAAGAAAAGRPCRVALAGGDTPRLTYRLLAESPLREAVPWPALEIFWGDERCVPASDPRSNQHMAREELLDQVPIPPAQIHPMTCSGDGTAAACDYQALLARCFGAQLPRFDLVLLGLGADGHTASLFPGSAALDEESAWVVPAQLPGQDFARLSLTLPVLNNAAEVVFLVAGAAKAAVLHRILAGSAPQLPAARVRPHQGALRWLVDAAAAGSG